MSSRIKKIFFVLIGMAILSLIWVFGYIKDFFPSNLSANILGTSQDLPQTPLTQDSDSDGLTDRNEILYGTDPFVKDTDGDGFIDGEEVATGHDPRKVDYAGNPGVYGTEENGTPNLTNRFVNQTVANLIGDDGQIDTTKFTNKTFASIARATMADAALSSFVTPLTDKDISITKDNSKKAVEEYLNKMMPIIEESQIGLNTIIKQISSITTTPFDSYAFFQQRYADLRSIPVPESWKEIHKQILSIHLRMSDISQFLNVDKINEDPLKAMVTINLFQDLTLESQNVFAMIIGNIRKNNLTVKNSLIESLNQAVPKQ